MTKKERDREYARRYYAAHREEVIAKVRAYYARNAELCRINARNYRDRERERIKLRRCGIAP